MNEGLKIKGKDSNKLLIFDLDDTLIISDAKIKVLDKETGKVIKEMTPEEYNYYVQHSKQMLSFEDFNKFGILKKAKFTKYMDLLKREYKKGTHICILTAREDSNLIRKFFLYHKINILPQLVIATGDPKWNFKGHKSEVASRKKEAIERLVKHGYNDLAFFDDNEENLKYAKKLEKDLGVSIKTIKTK